MIYQKILSSDSPYFVNFSCMGSFGEHRHADMEINFCLEGELTVILDKVPHTLKAMQTTLISPGVAHAFQTRGDAKVLTCIVGTSQLKRHFKNFSAYRFKSGIISLDNASDDRRMLLDAFLELIRLNDEIGERAEILRTANIYKTCAALLSELDGAPAPEASKINRVESESIEKVLELIYYNYKSKISVDEAATLAGYGKSNFCKIFKKISGMSFHDALNQRRIEVARGLLTESDLPISVISDEVGFSEAKAFCRVFRQSEGTSPLKYRKMR